MCESASLWQPATRMHFCFLSPCQPPVPSAACAAPQPPCTPPVPSAACAALRAARAVLPPLSLPSSLRCPCRPPSVVRAVQYCEISSRTAPPSPACRSVVPLSSVAPSSPCRPCRSSIARYHLAPPRCPLCLPSPLLLHRCSPVRSPFSPSSPLHYGNR